jgi:hypothetical protein
MDVIAVLEECWADWKYGYLYACGTVVCAQVVECARASAKVSIALCDETCRIDIWSIDD